jgi:hypothetical protein
LARASLMQRRFASHCCADAQALDERRWAEGTRLTGHFLPLRPKTGSYRHCNLHTQKAMPGWLLLHNYIPFREAEGHAASRGIPLALSIALNALKSGGLAQHDAARAGTRRGG